MANTRRLVVAPNWIGDMLMAHALLARLHADAPHSPIDVLAPASMLPLLKRMPEVAQAIASPAAVHGKLLLKQRWQQARELSQHGYTDAWVLPNSMKSALIPFLAGIPRRIGYVGESRYGLLNVIHRLSRSHPAPMLERYLALSRAPRAAVFNATATPSAPATQLHTDSKSQALTLQALGLAPPSTDQSIVALCPGAEFGSAKRWPIDHFALLSKELTAIGMTVWLIGGPADRTAATEITHRAGVSIYNLCGRTDLAQAIDLLALASVVVSNDSGLMHMAASLGRPLVALFGSSSPLHTPPRMALGAPAARIQYLGLECSPCFARECPLGHLRCLQELSVTRVFNETRACAGQ